MKILLVTDLYPIENEEISKAIFYFASEWKKQNHETEVIRSNFILNNFIRGRKLKKEGIYIENGIKIYNLNFHTPFLFDVYNKLPKDFSLKNYDVMISHMPAGALLANKLLKRDKIKYICAMHASDSVVLKDFKYSFYFRNALKKAYENADKTAARSPVLQCKAEELIEGIQDRTFVAYSGIADEYIQNSPEKKKFDEKEITITTAASLIKRKNIDIIIKALALTGDKRFKLKIIGEGPERKRLEKLAEKLNVKNRVTFKGKISRDKVIKELSLSDIFVLLSDNETFGLVYLEAMLCSNMVIAKKNDGIDGIIRNEQNGFLIEKNEYELCRYLNKTAAMKESEIEKIRLNAFETAINMSQSKAAREYLNNIQ